MPALLAVFLGLIVGVLVFAAFNVPRRHRRFGLGHVREAADNDAGFFRRTYPETPQGPGDSTKSPTGRNDPCPRGSDKKFKRCHGSVEESTSG
jgi:hypothetical protein